MYHDLFIILHYIVGRGEEGEKEEDGEGQENEKWGNREGGGVYEKEEEECEDGECAEAGRRGMIEVEQ